MRRSAPSPLEAPLGEVRASIEPIVYNIGDFPGLVGAALIVPDQVHKGSVNVVSIVDAPDADERLLKFNRDNVIWRRVDRGSSSGGLALDSRRSGISRSVMNPEAHLVYNRYLRIGLRGSAVLQLTVDTTEARVDQEKFAAIGEQLMVKDVKAAVRELHKAAKAGGYRSLGDELELGVPVTPNAFVAMWDVAGSTEMVRDNYGAFGNYYQRLGLSVMELARWHGAEVVTKKGDGQNVVLHLPNYVDRNSPKSIANFGMSHAVPLLEDIKAANDEAAKFYVPKPDIGVGLGLGYIDVMQTGEVNGPAFWDAYSDMKTDNSQASSRIARETLRLMAA